jgi:pimeloyl-ACP methyl ester carboxylesterase
VTDESELSRVGSSVTAWEQGGQRRRLAGFDIFTIEVGPSGDELDEPLLVIHGFPTCSYDYRDVVSGLATRRRVLLLDLVGFGMSEKPDIHFSVELYADVVIAYMADLGVTRFALLTHDMGDTVGGELLARQAEGAWAVEVTRRVLTNGSIYVEMAHLTDGQKLLLALGDEQLAEGPASTDIARSLAATMAEGSKRARGDVSDDADLICREGGNRLLARTIRYIEDRRRSEHRYTGAIETHPSPVGVIWGADDPIAVREMTAVFSEKRPDAKLHLLEGVGHYPMLEAPEDFLAALESSLGPQ